MALCAPISLTPSPRRRNLEAGGGFGCGLQRLPRRSTSSGDGDDNGSSSSFFFAAAAAADAAGCGQLPAAAAFFPDGIVLDPCWGGGERGGNEAATALAGDLPMATTATAAALPQATPATLQLQQLLAPSSVPVPSYAAAFDPASAFRASSFAAERLRLPAEEGGGGVGDRSRRQPGQEGTPLPPSLPERLPVSSPPPVPATPLRFQKGRQSEQEERPRKRATKNDNGGRGGESADDDDNGEESEESDRDDDDDDDDYEEDEQAAAMDAEVAHFVRRSSGCGNGSGNGNESKKIPAAAAAALAEAARPEEAATVLSASLGAQHPQVGKAWLLVARAHGAGSGGGGGGSGGGGERALTKCVFFFLISISFPSSLSSLALFLPRSRAHKNNEKNRAYEVCTHNIAAVSNGCSSSSLNRRRPPASVGTQWEEGEAAAAAAAAAAAVTSTASYKQQKQQKQVMGNAAGAAAAGRRGGGGGGGVGKKKQKKMATTTKS